MALIPAVGRKSFKNRSVIAMVYLSLILMGICMVVPFLITVTGSACNDFDYDRYHPLPRYLWSQRDRVVRALVPYFNTYRGWSQQLACQVPGVPEHWSSWSLAGRDIARNSVASDVPVSSMTAPTSKITIRMRAPTTPTAEASGAPSIPPTSPAPPDSTPRV